CRHRFCGIDRFNAVAQREQVPVRFWLAEHAPKQIDLLRDRFEEVIVHGNAPALPGLSLRLAHPELSCRQIDPLDLQSPDLAATHPGKKRDPYEIVDEW